MPAAGLTSPRIGITGVAFIGIISDATPRPRISTTRFQVPLLPCGAIRRFLTRWAYQFDSPVSVAAFRLYIQVPGSLCDELIAHDLLGTQLSSAGRLPADLERPASRTSRKAGRPAPTSPTPTATSPSYAVGSPPSAMEPPTRLHHARSEPGSQPRPPRSASSSNDTNREPPDNAIPK
jgi:hypothetical protein